MGRTSSFRCCLNDRIKDVDPTIISYQILITLICHKTSVSFRVREKKLFLKGTLNREKHYVQCVCSSEDNSYLGKYCLWLRYHLWPLIKYAYRNSSPIEFLFKVSFLWKLSSHHSFLLPCPAFNVPFTCCPFTCSFQPHVFC